MSKRILIIDDDVLVSKTISELLKKNGYAVEVALNGEEGIDKATLGAYDLIISDVRMPGINGIQAVEKIKAGYDEKGKKIKFMFITGFAEEDTPQHSLRLGVTDFLLKPFDLNQFLEAIQKNLTEDEVEQKATQKAEPYNPANRWQFPDNEFVHEKMVTIKETNMEGNVYFANYVAWQGEARETFLMHHPKIAEELQKHQHIKMITHSTYHRFVQESFFGDIVQIKIKTREVKKCSFSITFRFFNKQTGVFIGEGWQRVAFSDLQTGKITPIPHHILDLILPVQEGKKEMSAV